MNQRLVFLSLVYHSDNWKPWILVDSTGSSACYVGYVEKSLHTPLCSPRVFANQVASTVDHSITDYYHSMIGVSWAARICVYATGVVSKTCVA